MDFGVYETIAVTDMLGRLNTYAYTKFIDIELIGHIMTFTQSYPICVTKNDGQRKNQNN